MDLEKELALVALAPLNAWDLPFDAVDWRWPLVGWRVVGFIYLALCLATIISLIVIWRRRLATARSQQSPVRKTSRRDPACPTTPPGAVPEGEFDRILVKLDRFSGRLQRKPAKILRAIHRELTGYHEKTKLQNRRPDKTDPETQRRAGRVVEQLLAITGESGPLNVNELLSAARNKIAAMRKAANDPVDGRAWSLSDIEQRWQDLMQSHEFLREQFRAIRGLTAIHDRHLQSQAERERFRREIDRLNSRLENYELLESRFAPFLEHEELPAVTANAAEIYRMVRDECRIDDRARSVVARKRLRRLFDDVEAIVREHLTPSAELPVDLLTQLGQELRNMKAANDQLELSNTTLLADQAEFRDIGSFLHQYRIGEERWLTTIERFVTRQEKVLEELRAYVPFNDDVEAAAKAVRETLERTRRTLESVEGDGVQPVDQLAGEVVRRYRSLHADLDEGRRTICSLLPDADGPIDQMAARLVRRCQDLESAMADNVALGKKLLCSLHFSPRELREAPVIRHQLEVMSTEQRAPHGALRLGLCSTLLAWEGMEAALRQHRREDVIEALRLTRVREHLEWLVAELEKLSGEDLWKTGLTHGFAQDWLHELFRAELILRTYMTGDEVLAGLGEVVTEASSVIRIAIHRFGWRIEPVELLADAENASMASRREVSYRADPELRALPEVRRRVHSLLDTRENFVVDVERFRLITGDRQLGSCRVVVVSPAQWRD